MGQSPAEWNSVCPWRGDTEWWCHQHPDDPHTLWGWTKARTRQTAGKLSTQERPVYLVFCSLSIYKFQMPDALETDIHQHNQKTSNAKHEKKTHYSFHNIKKN